MIGGYYLDGRTAGSISVELELESDAVSVHGLEQPMRLPLSQVRISDRVANSARRITFPDGSVFETSDNLAVDRACEAAGIELRGGFLHWLESRWPVALAAMVAVVCLAFGLGRWGIPMLADKVARAIPAEIDAQIGNATMNLLDTHVFGPSRLPSERQDEVWRQFIAMTSSLDDDHRYNLQLRDGGKLGANALALPSGIVVMTDQLVLLAESDEELWAVMAHEIGHVKSRHALRKMVQATGVSAMAMALFGDVSSVGILGAAPVLLTAKNSRDFEREADRFAKDWLREQGIAESRFGDILCRMTAEAGESPSTSYFSTHPPVNERADCSATVD